MHLSAPFIIRVWFHCTIDHNCLSDPALHKGGAASHYFCEDVFRLLLHFLGISTQDKAGQVQARQGQVTGVAATIPPFFFVHTITRSSNRSSAVFLFPVDTRLLFDSCDSQCYAPFLNPPHALSIFLDTLCVLTAQPSQVSHIKSDQQLHYVNGYGALDYCTNTFLPLFLILSPSVLLLVLSSEKPRVDLYAYHNHAWNTIYTACTLITNSTTGHTSSTK